MIEDATALHDFFAAHPSEPGSVRAMLGPRIRRARVQRLRGMNLEEFGRRIAESMGRKRAFSNVTISNWETGRQEPSFGALLAIAQATRLPLEYFAGVGELERYPDRQVLSSDESAVAPELRTFEEAVQRCDPTSQRLILRQLQELLATLREEGGTSARRSAC